VKKLAALCLRRYLAALWNWVNLSDFVQEPACTYINNWEQTCLVPSRVVFHTAATIAANQLKLKCWPYWIQEKGHTYRTAAYLTTQNWNHVHCKRPIFVLIITALSLNHLRKNTLLFKCFRRSQSITNIYILCKLQRFTNFTFLLIIFKLVVRNNSFFYILCNLRFAIAYTSYWYAQHLTCG